LSWTSQEESMKTKQETSGPESPRLRWSEPKLIDIKMSGDHEYWGQYHCCNGASAKVCDNGPSGR
jgi:hypothetical protein